jgi:two-component system chemotaxis response regulator CheY
VTDEKLVLIVDDSKTVCSSVEYALSEVKCRVLKAENGKEALEVIDGVYNDENIISMIICDVNMPVMDGITFLKQVKMNEKYKFIPILVSTTEIEEEKKMEGRRAGACGWLVKPFDKDQIVRVVKKFLGY